MASSSRTVFIPKGDIDTTLAKAPLKGKNILEPFRSFALKNKLPFSILEDSAVSNDAEVHANEADLWFCLEGEVKFVCGGALSEARHRLFSNGSENPDELFAPTISGGEEFTMRAGDWLWIPAGEPHQHGTSGIARMIIIKIPQTQMNG